MTPTIPDKEAVARIEQVAAIIDPWTWPRYLALLAKFGKEHADEMWGRELQPSLTKARMILSLPPLASPPHGGRIMEGPVARPLTEWHEDDGNVVWWTLPVASPGWIGTPNDGDWPGYHTHWTPGPPPPAAPVSPLREGDSASRDLSQTADAATPKSAAPEQVKP